MKKTILCIDWSNLLFRALFINRLYGAKANMNYNTKEECKSFVYKFAMDVCSIINIFRPQNVILLTDSSHAWRKDVYESYKSGRVKTDGVNWDNIYKCSDDLKKCFVNQGCHIAETSHAEADDMAALCKELLYDTDIDANIIIVSADADIRQLISFDKKTKKYCVVYNATTKGATGKRYLYANQDFMDWYNTEDKVDIFFTNVDDNKCYIRDILNSNDKIELEVENPNEILVHKIFCGDDGDNVPSFYDWAHNGKFVRITPGKEKKIREALNISTSDDIISNCDKLQAVFESVCKREICDIDFNERLVRQRTLVELNSSLFPANIQEYKDSVKYMMDNNTLKFNGYLKASDVLQGTEYEGGDRKASIEADIFKDLQRYGLVDNKETNKLF